jgi:hypothetical protein
VRRPRPVLPAWVWGLIAIPVTALPLVLGLLALR